jgi:hypothetical protein
LVATPPVANAAPAAAAAPKPQTQLAQGATEGGFHKKKKR